MATLTRSIACGLALATLALLCGCSQFSKFLADAQKTSTIRQRVRAIAGPGAIDCGDNVLENLVRKNNACAIGALTERSAFYIVWNIPIGSSTITRGIAMNNTGEMFMTSETHEASGSKFAFTLCPSSKLVPDPTVTTAKVLTCNP